MVFVWEMNTLLWPWFRLVRYCNLPRLVCQEIPATLHIQSKHPYRSHGLFFKRYEYHAQWKLQSGIIFVLRSVSFKAARISTGIGSGTAAPWGLSRCKFSHGRSSASNFQCPGSGRFLRNTLAENCRSLSQFLSRKPWDCFMRNTVPKRLDPESRDVQGFEGLGRIWRECMCAIWNKITCIYIHM